MEILNQFRYILVCSIFLSLLNSLYATESLKLVETNERYPVGLFLEILEGKSASLTIEDIDKPEMEDKWIRSKKEIVCFLKKEKSPKEIFLSKLIYQTQFILKEMNYISIPCLKI
ncbi:MAG: hypothetical protein KBA66_11000 [Leptospiraceae bacterium]|nr:hypothetical protein [Leptospiraceae bacterium]